MPNNKRVLEYRMFINDAQSMFFTVPKLMYENLEISAKARYVYGYLQYYDRENNADFPSNSEIAKACGISKPTVRKALKELEEHNLVIL